jgi:hypothetical protein
MKIKLLLLALLSFPIANVFAQYSLNFANSSPVCQGTTGLIFSNIQVQNVPSSSVVFVTCTSSSNPSVINVSNVTVGPPFVSPVINFSVSAYVGGIGSTTLTFDITDGLSNTSSINVAYTVDPITNSNWNTASISACEGSSITLNPFVLETGGEFHYSGNTIPSGILSPTSIGFVSGSSYTIYHVTTNGACEDSSSVNFTVNDTPELTMLSGSASCAGNDGSASVTVFPSGTYDIVWSNGVLDQYTIIGLAPGLYSVDVIDPISGCLSNSSVTVGEYFPPLLYVEPIAASCNTASGSASLEITPTGSYDIAWSNGTLNAYNAINLNSGVYQVSVTETNNGCVSTETFSIDQNLFTINSIVNQPLCFGQSNGSIVLNTIPVLSDFSAIWSNGQSGLAATNLAPGEYWCEITSSTGCTQTSFFNVSEPPAIIAETISTQPTCGSADGAITVVGLAGGTGVISLDWSTGANTAIINGVPAGIYSLTMTDDNNCQAIKTIYLSNFGAAQIPANTFRPDCQQNNGSIDVTPILNPGQSVANISWNTTPVQITEDISLLDSGNYVCTFTTNDGCVSINGWDLPVVDPLTQEICLLTIDSLTTTNLVVWEPVQTVGISHYTIYRETSVPNEFILIDTVQATNQTVFNDVIASPKQHSWSYKIGAVNACNKESALSLKHKTIHLSISDVGGNIQIVWNLYQGIVPDFYTLWKYTDATGWVAINSSISNTTTSYVDNGSITEPGLDYFLEFAIPEPCSPEKAQDFNTIRSNREKGSHLIGQGTGDSNNSLNELEENGFMVYPNPVMDEFMIKNTNQTVNFGIYSSTGQLVIEGKSISGNTNVDVHQLGKGIYTIRFEMNDNLQFEKFIKL